MSRQSNRVVDGLIPGYGKIRKRGCSSSPSSSSKLHNYRFKRAIMVGKTRVGGGSRSSTPAPSWRMTPSSKSKLGGVESPNYDGGGGRSRPVSARKLAATLWEMNEMPSPQNLETRRRRREKETTRAREKTNRPVHTPGSLPPHLSDPSHSPVSERMDRSGTGSHHRISSSQRARLEDNNGEVFDSLSNSSLMEIEIRSRAQTPSGSTVGVKPRLKDVSNALTTSKELLKIIHRMWAHDNLPSSSMSLISALHTELERARLQVNQVIKDQRVDHTEVNYLLKCFAEEKALWKTKERRAIEAAIESIAGELEVERKLRRRSESLNKKLGQELAETKASFTKALKELESEKRAREIMEQVCDELAVDIGEDRAEAEELKRESVKVHEEVEKEREMLQLADKLREERVQMKLAEAKHQFEEKNALVDKLRSQLEAFLGNKGGGKKKGRKDEDLMTYMNRTNIGGTRKNKEYDDGEVENGVDCEEEESGGESDLHSIELNMDNNNKSFKWNHAHNSHKDSHKDSVDDELKWRNLVNGKASRRSTSSIQRNISDGNEWGIQENFVELEKQTPRRSHGDELQRYKSVKGLRDRILTNLKPQMSRDFDSVNHGSGSKSRTGETRSETLNGRRSKK
ncbi:plectin isoform X2 [Cynara cardunculus var. scolymus]|nr:plectin isoform X2 [Cynara cardunculus var. scolymus]